MPAGCAHGFQALTDPADTSYRIDRPFDPGQILTIAWNDPDLDIPRPLPVIEMSAADRDAPPLVDRVEALRTLRPAP